VDAFRRLCGIDGGWNLHPRVVAELVVKRFRNGLIALGLLLGVVVGFGAARNSWRALGDEQACALVAEGNFEAALDRGALRQSAPASLLTCRCQAWHAVDKPGRCADEVLEWASSAPSELATIPEGVLDFAIHDLVSRGADADAAQLAELAATGQPDELRLLELEIATRGRMEGEATVLMEIESRLSAHSGPSLPLKVRMLLARHYSEQSDFVGTLRALGDAPPATDDPSFETWFHARTHSLAELGRIQELQSSFERWADLGGSPAKLAAHYALRLSFAMREDPANSTLDLLERAVEREAEISDPELRMWLYDRLISHLVVDGQIEDALAVYDASVGKVELIGIDRDQIERSIDGQRMLSGLGKPRDALGSLVFEIEDARPGATLHVSSVGTAPSDANFEIHPVAPGEALRISRVAARWPERWVYRDDAGNTRASGAVWVPAGKERTIKVETRPAVPPLEYRSDSRNAGNGHRRVLALVLDCGDWRLTQYLRTRHELPFLDYAFENGSRAVLHMEPALTAAAMEALVWPDHQPTASVLGTVHQLGLELAGLESIGRNPFALAALLLPSRTSLFERVGADERVAANLLFSHGGINAGRHGEMVGPQGQHRRAHTGPARRHLSDLELAEISGLTGDRRSRDQVEVIAAELDTALRYAEPDHEADLVLMRIEPLDILTHGLFGEHLETAQDDGEGVLLDVYRYLDRRMAEIFEQLDGDDVLVVMSDHGIRNAMEHESDALFVAIGGNLSAGRAPGTPELAGVPFALQALLEQRPEDSEISILASFEAPSDGNATPSARGLIAASE
jgi:hypothetical protein